MLSKLQNPKVGYISRLLLLPLLTILFTAFALKIKKNDAISRIPRLEKSLTVVIDAGHGFINGKRHGAVGLNGISEDEIALAITKKIQQLNTDKNLTLIFTRKDEKFVEANERVKITKETNADLFVSIHAATSTKIKKDGKEFESPSNGFELYVTKDGNENQKHSKELGSAIINEIKGFMSIREPGIKQRNTGIYVIDAAPCPAVLLECGFISNSKDVAFLTNEKNQEKIAELVLKGIVNYAAAKHQNNSTTLHTSPIPKDTLPKTEIVIPQGTPIFTKAEIMPAFPGGENAWNRYMEKIIGENIDDLVKEGKEGICEVEFIVTTEGFVNKVKAKTMQDTKLAEVFIESIKKGPKWIPAIQNGRKVHCWSTQKLTLRLPVSKNVPISVATTYMQNLFIGIDNPLVISMGNTPGSQLQVTSNNGTITKVNSTWVARPSFAGKATITVTDPKSNQEGKVIFIVKELAVPVITLGDSKGGRIAANKITESKQLTIDEDWEIANYTMYFTGKGFDNPYFIAANKSPEFNQSVLEAIAKCQPGTTIVIDEIIIKQGNTKKTVPPLAFNLY